MSDDARLLDLQGLQRIIDVLIAQGYVVGPTVRDGAIVNAPVRTVDDLPRGWGDEQDAGHYRLRRRDDDALFGYAAGAQSPKPVLFPAEELIRRVQRPDEDAADEQGPGGAAGTVPAAPTALLGVRSCDLRALAIHDVVLLPTSGTGDRTPTTPSTWPREPCWSGRPVAPSDVPAPTSASRSTAPGPWRG